MKKFSFTGRGSDLFGILLVNTLLTLVTFGIYAPWAKARYLRYMAGHIEIDGEPFVFHGKGKELFWGIVKIVVLIIVLMVPMYITLFMEEMELFWVFYVLFLLIVIGLTPFFLHGALRYTFSRLSWKGVRMSYTGEKMTLAKMYWVGLFLTLITVGVYGFWFHMKLLRYIYSHVRIGNISFDFTGNGKDFFMCYVGGLLLSLVTLGIYLPWFYVKLIHFHLSNTWICQGERRIAVTTTLRGGEVLGFWLSRLLLVVVTAGIALPWVIAGWMKLRVNSLAVEGEIDTESLLQAPEEYASAMGFGFFDLGEGLWGVVFRL